jgi:hypothetical protein
MEKIEGWADVHVRDGFVEGWFGQDAEEKFPKATLVVGDERVFTESEVKAMLDEVFIALCYDFPPQEARIIALKHGLSWPDPA